MGLTLRQTVCTVLALIAAVAVYFIFGGMVHTEVISWICLAAAAPFGGVGFVKYHGMTLEKFLFVWVKSELFTARTLYFKPVNLYHESAKPYIEQKRRLTRKIVNDTEKSKNGKPH